MVIVRPRTESPAQARVVEEVLAWGSERPIPPSGLVERLLDRLSDAVDEWVSVQEQRSTRALRPLLITKTRLTRLACDGLQRDPEPYVHTWANVRGTLVHAAIEADLDGGRIRPTGTVVDAAWKRLATERSGDPSSLAAWLNARDADEREALQLESSTLLAGFREVWPALSDAPLRVRTEQRLVTMLGGRTIRMQGVPDIIVDSPVVDGRARKLLVDLKTGMPRGQHDRDELRFYALLATLATGVPPFRWATLYVTEGRIEFEDLSEANLSVAAIRVADAIRQATRLARHAMGDDSSRERITGGTWCRGCRRRSACESALSHP